MSKLRESRVREPIQHAWALLWTSAPDDWVRVRSSLIEKRDQILLGQLKRGDDSGMDSGDRGGMSGRVFRAASLVRLVDRAILWR